MGTRSNIIAKTAQGGWLRVYCHWDGYPDHHGPILLDHYWDQAKIDALLALGDLSSLGGEIGQKHAFDTRPDDACTAYGRDRGETGVEPKKHKSLATALKNTTGSGAEFVYVWDGQCWSITTPEAGLAGLANLREFMKGDTELVQTVKAFGGDFVIGKRAVKAGQA